MAQLSEQVKSNWEKYYNEHVKMFPPYEKKSFDQIWQETIDYPKPQGARTEEQSELWDNYEICEWIKRHVDHYTHFLMELDNIVDGHIYRDQNVPILHLLVNAKTTEQCFPWGTQMDEELKHAHITFHLSDSIQPDRKRHFPNCLLSTQLHTYHPLYYFYFERLREILGRWLGHQNNHKSKRDEDKTTRRVVMTYIIDTDKIQGHYPIFTNNMVPIHENQSIAIVQTKKNTYVRTKELDIGNLYFRIDRILNPDPEENYEKLSRDGAQIKTKKIFPNYPKSLYDRYEKIITNVLGYPRTKWEPELDSFVKNGNGKSGIGNLLGFMRLLHHLTPNENGQNKCKGCLILQMTSEASPKAKSLLATYKSDSEMMIEKDYGTRMTWVMVRESWGGSTPHDLNDGFYMIDWLPNTSKSELQQNLLTKLAMQFRHYNRIYFVYPTSASTMWTPSWHLSLLQIQPEELKFETSHDQGTTERVPDRIRFLLDTEEALLLWDNEAFADICTQTQADSTTKSSKIEKWYEPYVDDAYCFNKKNLEDLVIDSLFCRGDTDKNPAERLCGRKFKSFHLSKVLDQMKEEKEERDPRWQSEPRTSEEIERISKGLGKTLISGLLSKQDFEKIQKRLQSETMAVSPSKNEHYPFQSDVEKRQFTQYLSNHFQAWASKHLQTHLAMIKTIEAFEFNREKKILFIQVHNSSENECKVWEKYYRQQGFDTCVISISEHMTKDNILNFDDFLYEPLSDLRHYPNDPQTVLASLLDMTSFFHTFHLFFHPTKRDRSIVSTWQTAAAIHVSTETQEQMQHVTHQSSLFNTVVSASIHTLNGNSSLLFIDSSEKATVQLYTPNTGKKAGDSPLIVSLQDTEYPQSLNLSLYQQSLLTQLERVSICKSYHQNILTQLFLEESDIKASAPLVRNKKYRDLFPSDWERKSKGYFDYCTLKSLVPFAKNVHNLDSAIENLFNFSRNGNEFHVEKKSKNHLVMFSGTNPPSPYFLSKKSGADVDLFVFSTSTSTNKTTDSTSQHHFPAMFPDLYQWYNMEDGFQKRGTKAYILSMKNLIDRYLASSKVPSNVFVLFQQYENVDSLLLANLKRLVPDKRFIVVCNQSILQQGESWEDVVYCVWRDKITRSDYRSLHGVTSRVDFDHVVKAFDDTSESTMRVATWETLHDAIFSENWTDTNNAQLRTYEPPLEEPEPDVDDDQGSGSGGDDQGSGSGGDDQGSGSGDDDGDGGSGDDDGDGGSGGDDQGSASGDDDGGKGMQSDSETEKSVDLQYITDNLDVYNDLYSDRMEGATRTVSLRMIPEIDVKEVDSVCLCEQIRSQN